MDLSPASLLGLLRDTISDPAGVARRLMALRLPMAARWQLLLLVVVASVILTEVTFLAAGAPSAMSGLGANPLLAGLLQGALLLLMVGAVDRIGRALGGTGSFEDALLLVAWLQAVMACLQFVQLVTLLLLPPLSGLIAMASLAVFFWVLTGFVATLHGFRSRLQVFLMILVTLFAFSFVAASLLMLLGFRLPGP